MFIQVQLAHLCRRLSTAGQSKQEISPTGSAHLIAKLLVVWIIEVLARLGTALLDILLPGVALASVEDLLLNSNLLFSFNLAPSGLTLLAKAKQGLGGHGAGLARLEGLAGAHLEGLARYELLLGEHRHTGWQVQLLKSEQQIRI